ncbi:hypothetical protein COV13_00260 [Candidatus Woesearchaeota archaeon CG10_big_fil_rev_8_21_14_0_10_32_9]|nr:MAG: hypothetical protein COV13_00260 [Candidatus Woesearchaeota archaeon CG10_big_fil_rev_8_21_14_0_10_32_9]
MINEIVTRPKTEHKGIIINDEWYKLIITNHVDRDGAYYSVDTKNKTILTNLLDTDEVLRKVKDQYNNLPVNHYF